MREQRHHARIYGSPIAGVFATDIDSAHHFGRHSHDEFGFGFLMTGGQRWHSGRGTVRGYPGQIISTNPGEVHDGAPLGGGARRWRIIHVPAETMRRLIDGKSDTFIAQPVVDDPQLFGMVARAFERMEAGADSLPCEEQLVATCALLMHRHGTSFAAPPIPAADLSRVRERLADQTHGAPSLAELASIAGLSRYQVLRKFQKAYGMSPHAWSVQLRVERARGHLRRGEPLSIAAAMAGFADQSHMNRLFLRLLGFTPGSYQRAVLQ